MRTPRKKFTKEFKLEAVKMVLDGAMSKAEVGRRLGINQNLIGHWIKATEADGKSAFPGKGKLKQEDEELRKLRLEIRDLRMENEFLKKSAAYFASLKK
jgi:transposase